MLVFAAVALVAEVAHEDRPGVVAGTRGGRLTNREHMYRVDLARGAVHQVEPREAGHDRQVTIDLGLGGGVAVVDRRMEVAPPRNGIEFILVDGLIRVELTLDERYAFG